MHAPAHLGQEPRVDALVVARLDQLPHHPADHRRGNGNAPERDRPAVYAHIRRVLRG
jgi:hypothetical protein